MRIYRESAEHAWTEDSVRLIATPSSFARSALYYVQEVGHFRTLSSYFTERECLDSYLVVYTASGAGSLTYKNKTYALRPRQVFFINCMEYQRYASVPGEPWEILWVHLNGQSVRAYYDSYASEGESVRTLAADSAVPELLRGLVDLHRVRSKRAELLASQALVGLLTELLLSGSESEFAGMELPSPVADTVRRIEKRFSEKLSLEKLARLANMNKYHLAKLFKRHTGFSPGEYIIHARVTRAKELLRYSELTVAEISEQVGVDNVSHFINLFRNRVGQTPLVFRRSWQEP